MTKPYAVKCDACQWGKIDVQGTLCPKCQGNGSILVSDELEPLKPWEAALLLGALLISAFLVIYGIVALVLGFHR